MIDIHSHILPEVDDGSDSLETSLTLVKSYAEQGIDTVICTPHQNKGQICTEELKQAYNKLVEAAKGYNVKFLLGAEIYYYPEMVHDLSSGKLLTLNGTNKVLVEFSTTLPTDIAGDVVYELKLAGYTPIIAHIERYGYLTDEDYFSIKDNGGLIQINAGSVAYKNYLKRLKFLLKNDLVDFVASDCHDTKDRNVDFTAIKKLVKKKFPNCYNKLFEEQIKI